MNHWWCQWQFPKFWLHEWPLKHHHKTWFISHKKSDLENLQWIFDRYLRSIQFSKMDRDRIVDRIFCDREIYCKQDIVMINEKLVLLKRRGMRFFDTKLLCSFLHGWNAGTYIQSIKYIHVTHNTVTTWNSLE